LGLVDPDRPPADLLAVELLDGLGYTLGVRKLDEREAARPAAGAIDRNEHFLDVTDLAEDGFELALRGLEVQVPDEDFVTDGVLPPWTERFMQLRLRLIGLSSGRGDRGDRVVREGRGTPDGKVRRTAKARRRRA